MFNCAYCKNIAAFECSKDKFCSKHTDIHNNAHQANFHNAKDIYCRLKSKQKEELIIGIQKRLEVLRNCKEKISQSAAQIIKMINIALLDRIKEIDIVIQSYLNLMEIEILDEINTRKIEDILGSRLVPIEVKPFDYSVLEKHFKVELFESFTHSSQLRSFYEKFSADCNCMKLTEDGMHLIVGYDDHAVRIWKLSTMELESCLIGHTSCVQCVNVSKNGNYVVSGSWDKDIRIWSMQSKSLISVLYGHKEAVTSVEITSDNSLVVSASLDSTIKTWDIKTMTLVKTLNNDTEITPIVLWYNDIISGDNAGAIKVWSLSSNKSEILLRAYYKISCLAIAEEIGVLAIGCEYGSITVFDVHKKATIKTIKPHSTTILSISLNNFWVAATSKDNNTSISSLDASDLTIPQNSGPGLKLIVIGKFDKVFMSGYGTIEAQDPTGLFKYHTKMHFTYSMFRISYNKQIALVYSKQSQELVVWNFLECKQFSLIKSAFNWIELSEDGKFVVAGGESLIYWKNYKEPVVLEENSLDIKCVDITYDNELIISGSSDRMIRVWSIKPQHNYSIEIENLPQMLKMTRSKQFIVYCTDVLKVKVFNVANRSHVSEIEISNQPINFQISRNDEAILVDYGFKYIIYGLGKTGKLDASKQLSRNIYYEFTQEFNKLTSNLLSSG